MIVDAVRGTELLAQLPESAIDFLESVASEAGFRPGEMLFDESGVSDTFYVIVHGRVGLELTTPGGPPLVIQTLRDGDLIGVSWFFPPFRWEWRARALVDTAAIAFDAAAVRDKCVEDCELERQLLRSIAKATALRLHASRTQLLDLYGSRR